MHNRNIAEGAIHFCGGADEIRAVHIGFDLIYPTLHKIEFDVVRIAQLFDLLCRHRGGGDRTAAGDNHFTFHRVLLFIISMLLSLSARFRLQDRLPKTSRQIVIRGVQQRVQRVRVL